MSITEIDKILDQFGSAVIAYTRSEILDKPDPELMLAGLQAAEAALQRYIEEQIIGEDEVIVDEDPEGNLVADWDEEMIARNELRAEQRARLRGK